MIVKDFQETSVPKPELLKWRVFVQSKYFGCRHLDAGSCVLYEV